MKSKLSPLGKAIFVCALMLCLCLFVSSRFFAVTAIRTEGLIHLRESDVLRLAGIKLGDNLFLAEAAALERKVELNPLVASARVKKNFPGGLVINVTEREPAALILKADGNGAVEIDKQGFILYVHEAWPRGSLPVVTGLEREEILWPGAQINSARLQSVLSALEWMPPDIASLAEEINVNEIGQIKIFLASGLEVRFGKANRMDWKFSILSEVIKGEEFRSVSSAFRYIDVSSDKPVLGLK